MYKRVMVLPSRNFSQIMLLSVPDDMEEHEAFRYATSLIASYQESTDTDSYDELEEALEAKGFYRIDYTLGPNLD